MPARSRSHCRASRLMADPLSANPRRRATVRELVLVYLMAVVAFGYFAGTWGDGNTNSRLALVKAIAEEHRFTIDTTQIDREWAPFRTDDRSTYQGHYYSDKAMGSSLVAALAWAPAHAVLRAAGVPDSPRTFKVLATFLGSSLACALMAPLVFAFVTGRSGPRTAAWVTAAIVFGTPVFRYSTGLYGHVLAGLLCMGAFVIWYEAHRRSRLSLPRTFVSGLLLGFMIVTEYPTALLALILGFYILYVLHAQGRLSDWRPYGVMAAGFVLALTPLLYYNLQVYGDPFTTGYQHHATARFAAAHAHGIAGIGWPDPVVLFATTLHPFMGIFWQSPVLLLAIAGWVSARETVDRAAAWCSLAAISAYIVLLSGYYEWSGGMSYTPRHLIPVYPLFAIPLAFLPARWLPAALALTGVSIVQHTIAVTARWEYLVRLIQQTLDEQGHPTAFFVSTIWNACWRNLQAGLFVTNRGSLVLPVGYVSLVPLLILEGALCFALLRASAARSAPAVGAEKPSWAGH